MNTPPPALRLLSLESGVQSATLLLSASQGASPEFDFDATIRHGHPAAAKRGMPLRGTYYPHSFRGPLSEVDLGIDDGPEPEGCSPWSCRGDAGEETASEGGAE